MSRETIEKARRVIDMIENEIYGGYAYLSFNGMCKEYGVTSTDFYEFLSNAMKLIEEKEDEK